MVYFIKLVYGIVYYLKVSLILKKKKTISSYFLAFCVIKLITKEFSLNVVYCKFKQILVFILTSSIIFIYFNDFFKYIFRKLLRFVVISFSFIKYKIV